MATQPCYQCGGKGGTFSGGQPTHGKDGTVNKPGHGGSASQSVNQCPTCKGTGIQNSFGN